MALGSRLHLSLVNLPLWHKETSPGSKYCTGQSRELAGIIVGWKQPYIFVSNSKRLVLAMVLSLLDTHRWREMLFLVFPFRWTLLLLFPATAVFNITCKCQEMGSAWWMNFIRDWCFLFLPLHCYADHFSMEEILKPWAAYIISFPKMSLNFCTYRNASCCAHQKFSPSHTTKSYVWPDSVGGKYESL